MKIILHVLLIVGLGITLMLTARILTNSHKDHQEDPDLFLYDHGNADPETRQEILSQLYVFQEGYESRDTSKLDVYMDKLFSRENILILGTMPKEIYSGFEEAADLIGSDWLYWGDVRFQMDRANISCADTIAWFSTIGQVEFDMSRLLKPALRLSGIMVKEDSSWKFQQLQFQFDLDTTWVLLAIFLLALMLLLSIVKLIVLLVKMRK